MNTQRLITFPRRSRAGAAAVGALALTLAACEDEIAGPGDQLIEGQITIDASDPAFFAFMTFADGGSEVTVADPGTSTEWDIGFRRFTVKLNGGVAGPGTVAGANLRNNAEATDTEVAAFTMDDADAAWESVTVDDIAGAVFSEDGIIEDQGASWFRFDPSAGTLVANPGAAWKARESDGGFSIFRVAELNMMGNAPLGVTVEYRHQDAGGTLGPISTVAVDFSTGPGFIDLAGGTTVTPAGCNWDLSVSPSFTIDFNGDCDAGSFPLDATEDFTALTNADDAPEYGPFLSVISGAFPSSVDDATGVFWYNIEDNSRLWPTHNVFLVRVGTAVFKVQVIDYYNASGVSGFPTVRYQQLQ